MGGYTTGGRLLANVGTVVGTTLTVTAPAPPDWVSDGDFTIFHHAVLYNQTAATQPLIGWWNVIPIGMPRAGSSFGVQFVDGVVFTSRAFDAP